MAFLLPLIGLDALGVSVPGAGLFTAPVVAFQKDKDLDMSTLISLICSCMCSVMIVQRMINFPVKSPPFMMMFAAWCLSSCCSSVMVTKDTYDRFTRKSE